MKIAKEHKKIFMPIGGTWAEVAGDSGTLADFLQRHNIILDDKTEFARIRTEEGKLLLITCSALKVIIRWYE